MLDTWRRQAPLQRRRTYSDYAGAAQQLARVVARRLNPGSGFSAAGAGAAAAASALGAAAYRAQRNSQAATSGKLIHGSMGGYIAPVKTYKKKRKNRRAGVLNKRVKKAVKAIVRRSKPVKLGLWYRNEMQQVGSSVNRVRWDTLENNNYTGLLPFIQSEKIVTLSDGVTTSHTEEPGDLTSLFATQKKYMVYRRITYVFKNNTNSPAELVFYKTKCIDNTDYDPVEDLRNAYNTTKFTVTTTSSSLPGSPLLLEDNFMQYWNLNQDSHQYMRHWKVVEKKKMLLAGGDEATVSFMVRTPISLKREVAALYFKGFEAVIFRLMGRPSHDAANVANIGIANTLLDIYKKTVITAYSQKESTVLDNERTLANVSFSAMPNPVIGGDSIVTPYEAT